MAVLDLTPARPASVVSEAEAGPSRALPGLRSNLWEFLLAPFRDVDRGLGDALPAVSTSRKSRSARRTRREPIFTADRRDGG